jgi:enediyne biosynthesis protein E4
MKKWLLVLLIIILLSVFFVAKLFLINPSERPELSFKQASHLNLAGFTEIPIDFNHKFAEDNSLAFLGSAVIDIDGDDIHEFFVGGGSNQADALFKWRDGKFINIIASTKLSKNSATYGATSIDIDKDGDIDLIIARDDGVYLYLNNNRIFDGQKLSLNLPAKSVPTSIAVTDIEQDGDADLYISTFIRPEFFKSATYNDPEHTTKNILLRNDNGNFTDVTDSSGLVVNQNTFLTVFVDLDGDLLQDAVVSPNTDTVKIFKNNGDGTFTEQRAPTGYGFWMGLAVGDIDNDGDADLFLSNAGNTISKFFLKGDLRDDQLLDPEWALLRNDGNFTFTNINDEALLTNYGFSWGASFSDLNLDGHLDLLVSQNYIKWQAHKFSKLPGKAFIQDTGKFLPVTKISGLSNRFFGQSPLVTEINGDGYPDVLFLNINGPLRAFLNRGGDNHFVRVILPDNADSLGAKVVLERADGSHLIKQFFTSMGYMTDPSPEFIFGLGESSANVSVTIYRPSGHKQFIEDVQADSKIVFKKES